MIKRLTPDSRKIRAPPALLGNAGYPGGGQKPGPWALGAMLLIGRRALELEPVVSAGFSWYNCPNILKAEGRRRKAAGQPGRDGITEMRTILFQACIFILALSAGPAQAEVMVQVMSVQDAATAEKEAARLFSQGIPASSRTEESGDGGLRHRVYVGPFETKADAEAAAAAMKKNGAIKEFLVKNIQPPEAAEPLPDPRPMNGLPNVPVVSAPAAESIAGLPAPPANLPVAETPTYGEPVSPEQARSLSSAGLSGVPQPGAALPPAGNLPTYGQMEAARPATPAGGLPLGLKPGDDLPGLAPPTPAPVSVNSLSTAPSAGDGSSLASFEFLVDLSSSMRRKSNCQGLVKDEAVARLVRKMNRRIPGRSYQAALRVFGYKYAMSKADLTTLYYGPAAYSREGLESAIGRLTAAEAITPISEGLKAAEADFAALPSPRALLTFSDFQESLGSGQPLEEVEKSRRRYGSSLALHTFYLTTQPEAEQLAKSMAKAGGGQAWDICNLLGDEEAFEGMMLTIFGSSDLCYNAPPGAEVDERGCWIAAYAQFFDFNKSEVKSEFRPRLVEAARIIKETVAATDQVVIAGFTDNVGSQEYNLELGRRRAQAVADILTDEGVPSSRLSVVSYGKDKPVADNGTDEGRARNRRVEFHVGAVPQSY